MANRAEYTWNCDTCSFEIKTESNERPAELSVFKVNHIVFDQEKGWVEQVKFSLDQCWTCLRKPMKDKIPAQGVDENGQLA